MIRLGEMVLSPRTRPGRASSETECSDTSSMAQVGAAVYGNGWRDRDVSALWLVEILHPTLPHPSERKHSPGTPVRDETDETAKDGAPGRDARSVRF
jgi:hypothetical protein